MNYGEYAVLAPDYQYTDIYRACPDFDCEMTRDEHGFLCSLLNMQHPSKIVEVGVSGGGTTVTVMRQMADSGRVGKMYSVDTNSKWYNNDSKKTGFIYDELYKAPENSLYEHEFIFGHTVADAIVEIGNNIDFVILDTTHALPGEVLDFLALYPYLTNDAVLVLHDVNLNVLGARETRAKSYYRDAIATRLLFAMVKGEKYYDFSIPNIAAIRLNSSSCQCIKDVFFSLVMRWNYLPENNFLAEYRKLYAMSYGDAFMALFDNAVNLNVGYVTRSPTESKKKDEDISLAKLRAYNLLYLRWIVLKQKQMAIDEYFVRDNISRIGIYGFGDAGQRLLDELRDSRVAVEYIIDRNKDKICCELPVYDDKEELPSVDAIVVTALLSYFEIERELGKRVQCPIISLADVIL